MKKSDFLNKVEKIFREMLDEPSLSITPATSPHDIAKWDSLNHVKLIVAIEEEFAVEFTAEEMASVRCVQDILSVLEKKADEK